MENGIITKGSERGEQETEETVLRPFSVGSLPSIYYIPDFVSPAEQSHLLHQVNGAPMTKWKMLKNRRLQNWGGVVHEKGLLAQVLPPWLITVTQRIAKETTLFPAPINHVLVNEYLPGQGIMPHQDGPLYHPVVAILSLGSPALMRFTPHARILGITKEGIDEQQQQHTRSQGGKELSTFSVALMPGSLLVFKDSAYEDYLHGIDESSEHMLDETVVNAYACICQDEDRHRDGLQEVQSMPAEEQCTKGILRRTGTRVSLTCRHVSKIQKNFLRL
ncbi:hypothetical protein CY35_14G102600 [Sphagnum magellanicum]|nr:hypothetical protein CY35_14G102600 [Sphagnum magellanicum]